MMDFTDMAMRGPECAILSSAGIFSLCWCEEIGGRFSDSLICAPHPLNTNWETKGLLESFNRGFETSVRPSARATSVRKRTCLYKRNPNLATSMGFEGKTGKLDLSGFGLIVALESIEESSGMKPSSTHCSNRATQFINGGW